MRPVAAGTRATTGCEVSVARQRSQAQAVAYAPVQAEALYHRASARFEADADSGRDALTDAYYAAFACGHDECALRAATRLARNHTFHWDFEGAWPWIRQADAFVARSPDSTRREAVRLAAIRSQALRGKARPADALAASEQAIAGAEALGPEGRHDLIFALLTAADALRSLGRDEEARPGCRSRVGTFAGSSSPSRASASHLVLGKLYRKVQRHDDAVLALQAGLALPEIEPHDLAEIAYELGADPKRYKAHYRRAVELDRLDRVGEADDAFRRCIELRPTYPRCFIGLATLYADFGRDLSAQQILAEGLTISPRDAGLWHSLSLLHTTFGRPADAVTAAAGAAPDDGEDDELTARAP